MTRRMYDSTNSATIPPDGDLVAGYDDGAYRWSDADWARWPDKVHVHIAVLPTTDSGHVLDVERGNATPEQAPAWVSMRRTAGTDPTVYCSLDTWPTLHQVFAAAGVVEPHWWIAAVPGDGMVMIEGAVAHQWASPGLWDVSVVADYWPGVDPTPEAPTQTFSSPSLRCDHVVVRLAGGHGWIASPVPAGRVLSVVTADESPEAVGRYDDVPVLDGVAEQSSADAPNGAVVVHGPDGTFGVAIWSIV